MRSLFLPLFLLAACHAGGASGNAAAADSHIDATGAAAPSTPVDRAPFAVQELARFDGPWAMAFLPGGAALVTETAGRLKLWQQGRPTLDVAGVPAVAEVGQGGLLDVVLSPRFAEDGFVYLTYSEPGPGGSGLALARGRLVPGANDARLDGVQVIWRDQARGRGGQFGAILLFAPDGNSLYLSSGERQRFTPAQDPNQPLGKILRLTPDGKPAPGNPGAGKTGTPSVVVTDPPRDTEAAKTASGRRVALAGPNLAPAETWSSGHRNPYGLAFTPDGRLWETEMGPRGGDELNLILPGRNYGWPIVSNGDNYDGVPIPDHPTRPEFAAPKLWWNPSISPTSLLVYSGPLFPQWQGSGFIGALSGQALIRVTFHGDTASKAQQWDMGTRIRFVTQGPDGAIYLLEDGSPGRLLRLAPKH
ncbi:MAG: aldose sugar dehydrogenase [Sphingomonadales bacterium]|jgi:glucose/arabinose dehydrogenase|nr:aldose sugar dehydrogenase [Sphingomonadales bacterium]